MKSDWLPHYNESNRAQAYSNRILTLARFIFDQLFFAQLKLSTLPSV